MSGACSGTLVPNPTATLLLGDKKRATGGTLEDLDGDGACGGFEAGNCDIGGHRLSA